MGVCRCTMVGRLQVRLQLSDALSETGTVRTAMSCSGVVLVDRCAHHRPCTPGVLSSSLVRCVGMCTKEQRGECGRGRPLVMRNRQCVLQPQSSSRPSLHTGTADEEHAQRIGTRMDADNGLHHSQPLIPTGRLGQ